MKAARESFSNTPEHQAALSEAKTAKAQVKALRVTASPDLPAASLAWIAAKGKLNKMESTLIDKNPAVVAGREEVAKRTAAVVEAYAKVAQQREAERLARVREAEEQKRNR